ncbi:MAG: diguanylate cyclase [Acidimicrobiia bacterium]
MTLRRRITLFVALAVVIPITAVVVQMLVLLRNEESQRAAERVETARAGAATNVEWRQQRLDDAVDTAADRLAGVPDGELAPALVDLVAFTRLDYLAVVGPDGEPVAVVPGRETKLSPAPTVASLLDRSTPAMTAFAPVGERRLLGAIWLVDQFLSTLAAGDQVDFTVVAGGTAVAGEGAGKRLEAPEGDIGEGTVAGRSVVAGAIEVPSAGGAALVASTQKPSTNLLSGPVPIVLGMVLLIIVLLIVLVGYVVSGLVTQPVSELVTAVQAVARGDLDRKVSAKGDVEVATLGRVFNEMTDNLREQMQKLEQSRVEFREAVTRLGDVLAATVDLDGIIAAVLEVSALTVRAEAAVFYDLVASPARVRARAVHAGSELKVSPNELDLNGTGLAGAAARLGDLLAVPGPATLDPLEPQVAAAVAVPLIVGGRLHAVLAVYGKQSGGAFAPEDEEMLRMLARQATVAIDNAVLHAEVKQHAITDGLTGLFNRREFERRCHQELQRAERFNDPMGIVMVDIDFFKKVNDNYDHITGDAALIEVAARLHTAVRDIDTVARWGGEEFAILLPRAGLEETAIVAERIRTLVAAKPLHYNEHVIPLTVSVGYACRPVHSRRQKELVLLADHALQAAKRNGRNRVERAIAPGDAPLTVVKPREAAG